MNMWVIRVGIFLAVLIALGSVFLLFKEWGASVEREKAAAEVIKTLQQENTKNFQIGSGLEKKLAEFQQNNQKLKEDLDAQIAKNSIYRQCVVPDDGVRLFNTTLGGLSAS